MRQHIRTVVVVGLGVGLMAFFLRNANLGRVAVAIAGARWDLLAGALSLTLLMYVVRVIRWRALLEPVGPVRFSAAFRATVMGFTASALLPGRVGEVLRPYVLARREGLSASATIATIVLERLLDVVAIMLLFGAAVVFAGPDALGGGNPQLLDAVRVSAAGLGIAASVALGLAFLAAGDPDRVERIVDRASAHLPGRMARALTSVSRRFVEGLGILRRAEILLRAFAWSMLLWGSLGGALWLASAAFGIVLPLSGAATLLVLVAIGVAVPTPAGIGGYHAAYEVGATSLYGASDEAAVGAALVLHAISFVPVSVVGVIFMAQDGVRLGGVRGMAAPDPDHVEGSSAAVGGVSAESEGRG